MRARISTRLGGWWLLLIVLLTLVPEATALPGADRIAELEEEMRRLQSGGDALLELNLNAELGQELLDAERHAEAIPHFERAIVLAREASQTRLLLANLVNLTYSCFHIGKLERGEEASQEAFGLAEQLNLPDHTRALLVNSGSVRLRLGDYESAVRAFSRALELQDRKDAGGMAILLSNLAVAYMYLGDREGALGLLDDAQAWAGDANDSRIVAAVLSNRGDVMVLEGKPEAAIELLEQALAMRKVHAGEREVARSHHSLGAAFKSIERWDEALKHLDTALETQERLGLHPDRVGTLSTLAETYAKLDRPEEAEAAALTGLEMATRMQLAAKRVGTLVALSRAFEAQGRWKEALQAEREAREAEADLLDEDVRSAFAEVGREKEAREKEHELELLRRDNQLRVQQGTLLLMGSLVLLAAALVGWVSYLSNRRVLKELDRAHGELRRANDATIKRTLELEHALSEVKDLEGDRLRASRLESIGTLAGGIAHDFNNVLTVLSGNLSIARQELHDRPGQNELLAEAQAAAEQGERLATQLLAFAKGGAPVCELCDLALVIREAATLACSGSNAQLRFDFAEDLWPAEIDPGQISQVINNLALNAVQSMQRGGELLIRGENRPGRPENGGRWLSVPHVRISVSDDGDGIREEDRERVFDPYFSTKEGGSGLGLATAYAIVDRHEGTLGFETEVGRGCIFELCLPAVTDVLPRRAVREAATEPGSGRVLVVDDEPMLRTMYQRSLKRLGYEVLLAADGAQALACFQEAARDGRPVDLVVMDLTLTGGSGGVDVFSQIRELNPNVAGIVASGYSDSAVLAEYERYGFVGGLKKPFGVEALGRALQTARAQTNPQ